MMAYFHLFGKNMQCQDIILDMVYYFIVNRKQFITCSVYFGMCCFCFLLHTRQQNNNSFIKLSSSIKLHSCLKLNACSHFLIIILEIGKDERLLSVVVCLLQCLCHPFFSGDTNSYLPSHPKRF